MTDLVVERCDPRERAGEIKDLFARNDRAHFDAVFERVYQRRAEHGLRSWVGVQDGRVVMHISVSPQRFASNGESRVGGFLGDLMVDAPFRDFWNSTRLLRTMVKDVREDGQLDFLLTATTEDAEPVFKAGGFRVAAQVRRYVLPLNALYLAYRRIRGRARRLTVERRDNSSEPPHEILHGWGAGEMWRPVAKKSYYETRIPTTAHSEAYWLHIADAGGRTAGWVLVTPNRELPECNVADCFWEAGVEPAELLLAAGRWVRTQSFRRLVATAPAGSGLAAMAKRSGFITRGFGSPLLLRTIRESSFPPISRWSMSTFPLSNW